MPVDPPVEHSQEYVTLRAYLERLVDERDRQYDTRFRSGDIAVQAALAAQEKATSTALAAQEKATAAAFAASEKAIDKAEDAQREYNARSNEFRGQLDDQAKTLMPRLEVDSRFLAITEKIDLSQKTADDKMTVFSKDIAGLRESRSAGQGQTVQSEKAGIRDQWVIGVIIGVIIGAVEIGLRLAGK